MHMQVLSKAQHRSSELLGDVSAAIQAAVEQGKVTPSRGAVLEKQYARSLQAYTYLALKQPTEALPGMAEGIPVRAPDPVAQ